MTNAFQPWNFFFKQKKKKILRPLFSTKTGRTQFFGQSLIFLFSHQILPTHKSWLLSNFRTNKTQKSLLDFLLQFSEVWKLRKSLTKSEYIYIYIYMYYFLNIIIFVTFLLWWVILQLPWLICVVLSVIYMLLAWWSYYLHICLTCITFLLHDWSWMFPWLFLTQLQCLKKCPGNYSQALKAVPRTLRMM